MKKYSRAKLIKYFEKLPPRSKPCNENVCPIQLFTGCRHFISAVGIDKDLALAFDDHVGVRALGPDGWKNLTAARIVKIAKGLGT